MCDLGVYAASKAGLEAASDALRVELAHTKVSKTSLAKAVCLMFSKCPLFSLQVHIVLLDPGYILEHTPLASRSFFISVFHFMSHISYPGKETITKP